MRVFDKMDNWKVVQVIFQDDEDFDIKRAVQRYYKKIKNEGSIVPIAQHTADGAGKSMAFSANWVLDQDH